MAVPDFQSIMLPLLSASAAGGALRLRDLAPQVARHFALTDEDLVQRLPSGMQTVFDNRIHWARFYLVKAGLLDSPVRGAVQLTDEGRHVLEAGRDRIDVAFLKTLPRFQQYVSSVSPNGAAPEAAPAEAPSTPREQLESAWLALRTELGRDMLVTIKERPPDFFERLVIDLLVQMGYGGSRPEAAQAIGGPGDEGIDGIINEDKLGLDAVYVQAKRWERPVGRPDVQSFVGSLEGHRAHKGVFITTSSFSSDAHEFVKRIGQRVVLIDGQRLVQLMIEHHVGVLTDDTFEVLKLNESYFAETD